MVAGGFRTFVAGETLDEDKINDFLMQGVLVFADEAARDAAITDPVHGQVAFLKDTDSTVFYDGADWVPLGVGLEVEFLLIAGGGSGAPQFHGGGGGAGGYRCNVEGEDSGGGNDAEALLVLTDTPKTFGLTVGAGAPAVVSTANGPNGAQGSNSFFDAVGVAIGGGAGGGFSTPPAGSGGSGGGASGYRKGAGNIGLGLRTQGFDGGQASAAATTPGGGGGAGELGQNAPSTTQAGKGGDGVSSSITGTAVVRGGGGGGAVGDAGGSFGAGGAGGGGAGNGTSGTANTGGGGGASNTSTSGAGGSGVVILRLDSGVSVSFSGGVTHTTATVGDKTAYIVTAAGPTDTVTIG